MKTSCLLCRVVSVLHLCRKKERKKVGEDERELVYAINMKQLSSGKHSLQYGAHITPPPMTGGNADH